MTDSELLLRLAVAALGGLAVGIEREWSARTDGEHSRFGGVRTFLLLGLAGGLGAALAGEAGWVVGALPLAGTMLVVIAAYLVSAWQGTIDATTEVAGVVVVAAGALAGTGRLAVASAVFAGTALVLIEKSAMHRAVERIRSEELAAAARFAVLALVVLPLLPNEPIDWLVGVEPRQLWSMVLLFAGLSFVGYLAQRVAGPARGYSLAGLLGGIVSSTAVTFNFARESRERPESAAALARGALAASVIMPLRVAVLSAVLQAQVAIELLPAVAVPIVLGTGAVVYDLWRQGRNRQSVEAGLLPSNPLRLGAAVQMTAIFAVVLAILSMVRDRFGTQGLIGGAVLLGLTDLDALTFSMNRLAASGTAEALAARVLVVGMLANTLFKATLALALGNARFRWICGIGLGALAALFAAALALLGGSPVA